MQKMNGRRRSDWYIAQLELIKGCKDDSRNIRGKHALWRLKVISEQNVCDDHGKWTKIVLNNV